jgi:hypothetical protein
MAKHGIFVKKYGEEDNLISELSSEMTGNYYEAFREAADEALAISQDDNNYFAEVYMVDDEGNIINDEKEGPVFSTYDKDKEDELMEKEESGRRLYEIDEEGEMTYAKKKEENEKNIYLVSMTETVAYLYEIKASSEDEAVKICENKWGNGTLGKVVKKDTTDRFFQSEGIK